MKFTEQQQIEAADSFIGWMYSFLRVNDIHMAPEGLESTIDFDFAGYSAFMDVSFYEDGELYCDSLDYLNEAGELGRIHAMDVPYFIAHLHENMMNKVRPVSGFASLKFNDFLGIRNMVTFTTNPKALKNG